MKAFINHISTISSQDSFNNKNWINKIATIDETTPLIQPDYKEFISPSSLRRLSLILKTSIATSVICKQNSTIDFDAIIVGTGLGCLTDTEKFLRNIFHKKSEYISPTAFIQSTHNTISGQISLYFQNHAYNMTHTQNHVSFELALIDAILCLKEGKKNVLVGATDEKIDFIDKLDKTLIPKEFPFTTISSFFSLIPSKNSAKGCFIADVKVKNTKKELSRYIDGFLNSNQLDKKDLNIVLHSGKTVQVDDKLTTVINYLSYSGVNFSASAFATHFAKDFLSQNNLKYALVINTLYDNATGLILIQRND